MHLGIQFASQAEIEKEFQAPAHDSATRPHATKVGRQGYSWRGQWWRWRWRWRWRAAIYVFAVAVATIVVVVVVVSACRCHHRQSRTAWTIARSDANQARTGNVEPARPQPKRKFASAANVARDTITTSLSF